MEEGVLIEEMPPSNRPVDKPWAFPSLGIDMGGASSLGVGYPWAGGPDFFKESKLSRSYGASQ